MAVIVFQLQIWSVLLAVGFWDYQTVATQASGVKIKSSSFDSSLERLAWAGSSGFECDAKCKQACLAITPEAAGPTGDSLSQRTDECIAGCGCAGGSDHVFATLDGGEMFISTDSGQSWKELAKQVPSYIQKEPHNLRHVHVSHTDPRSVVLLTNTTTSWISSDGGSSWKPLKLTQRFGFFGERRITAWRWHPTKKDWALAESKGTPEPKGSSKLNNAKTKQSTHLAFYTQDGGASFKLLAEDVEQCHWAVRSRGDTRRVLFTRHVQPESLAMPLEIHAIEDFTTNKKTVLLGKGALGAGPATAMKVFFHYNFIFALARQEGSSGSLQLWFYSDQKPNGFRAAKWPRGAAPVHNKQLRRMQVLYSAGESAMIYVPVSNQALASGHVFSCNYRSDEMRPILTDVRHVGIGGDLGYADWQALNGIDGAFLANRAVLAKGKNLDKTDMKFDSQEEDLEDDIKGASLAKENNLDGNDGESGASPQDDSAVKPRFITRTYLSLDMGSVWQPLKAPEKGMSGEALPGCESGPSSSDCLLHLARWESSFAAPGLILASGNSGVRLSANPEHSSIFLSRDAGISWKQILEGPHEFSLLGHGDMFVAIPFQSPGSLLYSTDNGRQWTTVNVVPNTKKGFVVDGLFTHPSHTDLRVFLALASEARQGVVLASLDLRDALPQSCKLLDSAGASDSDFEKWSPADALEDSHASKRPVCISGLRTSYVRRKPDRTCNTGATKLPPLDFRKDTTCQCSAVDWTCDIGYHRTSYTRDAPCELLEGSTAPNITKLCDATLAADVEVTRGYARIVGNRCSGGVDLSPKREPCPGNTGLHGYIKGLFFSYRSPVYMAMGIVLLFSLFAIHRQRTGKGMLGRRKKYDDARAKHDEEDDPERELLIDPSKL